MGWLGTALSYFTGGLAGAYNSYQQNNSIAQQIEFQREENQKNRDFSKQMYEQQWADYMKNYPELMQMENDAQFNLWKNQFGTQAAYNSENAQVARSLVAGLNPSQNGLIQGSNMNMQPSTVQPPPHIQGSPLGGSISPTGIPDLLPNNLLAQAAAFAKDMSQVDINKKQLDKMESEIDKILAEKDLIDSQRSYQEIKNGVYQVLGYKKETVEIMNIVKQSYMYEAQGDASAAAAEMHKAQALLFDSERALNDEKKPFVGKLMQSEIDRNKSEYKRNLAQAAEAGAGKELKESQKRFQDMQNQLKEQEVSPDVLAERGNALVQEFFAKGQMSREAAQYSKLEADRIADINNRRGNSAAFRELDSFFDWLKKKLPFSGNVSVGVNSSTTNSTSDINVHKK